MTLARRDAIFPLLSLLPAAAAAAVLLLAAALAWHARPLTDDLFIPAHLRDAGVAAGLRAYWTGWGSRWISYLANGTLPEWLGLRRTYAANLWLCGGAWLGAIALALRHAGGVAWGTAAGTAAAVAAVVWANAVANGAAGDFFYWGVGARENVLGVAVPICGFALLCRGGRASWGGAALIALTPGVHELWGAFGLAWAGLGLAAELRGRREWRPWAAAVASTLVHLGIVLAAPGPRGRAAQTLAADATLPAASLIIAQSIDVVREMAFDPRLMLLAAIAWTLPRPAIGGPRFPAWAVAAAAVLGVAAALVLHATATHVPIPGRLRSGVHTTLALGLVTASLSLPRPTLPRGATLALPVLFALALVASPGVEIGLRDLRTNAPRWSAALDEHHARLAAAGPGDVVTLAPPPPTPGAFWKQEVVDDPADFRNYHTRIYYGVAGIRITLR